MKSRLMTGTVPQPLAMLLLLPLVLASAALAQTPVDEDGNPVGTVLSDDDAAVTLRTAADLEALVGPVALYPDDLLAIVLPAATYPLEIVQAARFLEQLDNDSSLKPDEDWDDSVVALLNYPEVLRMMSEDIDWTWQLGEAVVAQQADVVAAVESFRDRAYAAGNLESDERQTVTVNDEEIIEIAPADDEVIYVPYYEPEQVVVRQPRRVYYYYPDPYPVYYYPYPTGHHFVSGYFWGVTTAFRIGWLTDHLHVHHHSFHGHPYYGRHYYGHYWRRPSISVFNRYYGHYSDRGYRHRYGSYWRPRHHGGARPGHYSSRSRYYSNRRRSSSDDGYAREDRRDRHSNRRDNSRQIGDRQARRDSERRRSSVPRRDDEPIRFRSRGDNPREPVNIRARQNDSARSTNNRRNVTERRNERRDAARRTTIPAGSARNERREQLRRSDNSRRITPSRRSVPTAPTQRRSAPVVRREAPPVRRAAPAPSRRQAEQPRREQRAAPARSNRPSSHRSSRPAPAPARDSRRGNSGRDRRDRH